MPIRYLLFDLDETLYPRTAGIMQRIGHLIRQYISDRMGYTAEQADSLARRYYREYGTSMRGLLLNDNLDADDFLAYVHGFSLDSLDANPQLDALLSSLPLDKVIFTNADRAHAERVLDRLGVAHHFTRIIDIVAVNYVSKPNLEAYLDCLDLLGAKASECVLIEDSARNVEPATALGMVTVLVDGDEDTSADYQIDRILDLAPVIEDICRRWGCRSPQMPRLIADGTED